MELIHILIMIVHAIVICTVGFIMFFSTNIYLNGLLVASLLLTLLQTFYFDGCLLAKHEGLLPIVNMNLTEVIQKCLRVENTTTKDLEKIFVGLTLFGALCKFGILLSIKYLYNKSYGEFIQQLLKGNYGKYVSYLI